MEEGTDSTIVIECRTEDAILGTARMIVVGCWLVPSGFSIIEDMALMEILGRTDMTSFPTRADFTSGDSRHDSKSAG